MNLETRWLALLAGFALAGSQPLSAQTPQPGTLPLPAENAPFFDRKESSVICNLVRCLHLAPLVQNGRE